MDRVVDYGNPDSSTGKDGLDPGIISFSMCRKTKLVMDRPMKREITKLSPSMLVLNLEVDNLQQDINS
ncbi:unnamed protein product [Dovyalis caffra]|uniref:Uncharacterized protein n=1 Tax=Dovyalis caffra TaxID=77055 RepID=A0AAV1SHV0_9ROSI|nr:unnamed protein product [Dovyalis caffra]